MTIRREVLLECDGFGGACHTAAMIANSTVREARKEARESGWLLRRAGHGDLCRECHGKYVHARAALGEP